jgi:hypothetical protein
MPKFQSKGKKGSDGTVLEDKKITKSKKPKNYSVKNFSFAYQRYILLLLKKIDSSKQMASNTNLIMSDLVNVVSHDIAEHTFRSFAKSSNKMVNYQNVKTAVRDILSGDLISHTIDEMDRTYAHLAVLASKKAEKKTDADEQENSE